MIGIDIHRLALSEIFQDGDEILVGMREEGALFVQFRGPVSKQNGPAILSDTPPPPLPPLLRPPSSPSRGSITDDTALGAAAAPLPP